MLLPTSRIEHDKGIKFYEQDILYDDYIYSGDMDLNLNIDYSNPGFGITLLNSEGSTLSEKEEILLFKLGNKSLEVIYKNKNLQKTLSIYNAAYAKTYTENLQIKLTKRNNIYNIFIGEQKVCNFKSSCEFNTYNLAYYSNSDNIINNINIAANIPYSWIVNMENTNGGYIEFNRDGFELKHCNGIAEVEQIDIELKPGKYYLKYSKENDTDMVPYVFTSDNKLITDDNKNILGKNKSFTLEHKQKISLKFKGTYGKINKVFITSLSDNEYIRTSPDKGDYISIGGSSIRFDLTKLKQIEFTGIITHCPGYSHTSPVDYSIIEDMYKTYGLFDLDIAQNVDYKYKYTKEDNTLYIYKNNNIIKSFKLLGTSLIVFKNINAHITDFTITDLKGNNSNVIIENTIKKSVPGSIKSPIIVTDNNNTPLDLTSSYRVYNKDNKDYYYFTNIEREYFDAKHTIKLTNSVSDKTGTIICYGIKKDSKLDMDKILHIDKIGLDNIDNCANLYDVIFEKDLKYLDRKSKEIRFNNVDDYKLIIVDYLKSESYSVNYNYKYNNYEVDISTNKEDSVKVIYDNTEKEIDDIEYINEQLYLNTKIIPTTDCYIVLGRSD